jgi:hypothetical protein
LLTLLLVRRATPISIEDEIAHLRAHRALDAYRQNGEWFDVHPNVLKLMHRSLTFQRVAVEEEKAT